MKVNKEVIMNPRIKRLLIKIPIGIGLFLVLLAGYVYFPWPMPAAKSFELVAHCGVHQTYPLDNLTNETCTAKIIYPPTHSFIGNTIPSMREAFEKGATIVELDIHRTADKHLIVFHDYTLECRTDGTGVTNEQTLEYLKSLDIGYGYTADDGKTFPLRGIGIGMMPTLEEVLAAFPDKRFVVNNKDGGSETVEIFANFIKTLPAEQRSHLYYWGTQYERLKKEVPELKKYIFGARELKRCLCDYTIRMLLTGTLSPECRQHVLAAPLRVLRSVPGWPNLILARAHQAGAKFFVTDVDTEEQLEEVKNLPLDGIQTNRIEIIGPLLNDNQ